MSRKSMKDKGYDFEEGRQKYKDRRKANKDFMEGLGLPKLSRSGGGVGSSDGGISIGIGGIIFLFFVLLCLASLAGDAQ